MDDKLEVITEDLSQHPKCSHGPTILFSRKTAKSSQPELFFACSACRSRDDCPFYVLKTDYDKGIRSNYNDSLQINHDPNLAYEICKKVLQKNADKRCFCHTCNILLRSKHIGKHKKHEIRIGITDEEMKLPTKILQPLDHDKTQAQYFFSDNTLNFFGNIIQDLKIRKVICMGAPRLHEYLRSKTQINSFLLDIDHRFSYFFDQTEFAWFNMFNNYFFAENIQQELFEQFLKKESDGPTLLFTDPPFGGRTELLVQTIKTISSLYEICNSRHEILPTIWIFPYYMEMYITKFMPEMQMSDFKIDYINHELYNDGVKGRKYGSPVRFFTNISLNMIKLPTKYGYKYCAVCEMWKGAENQHCSICKICPSKNGETYRHCDICAICVKPNYKHCTRCRRCTQKANHSCLEYQKNLNCWICQQHGHSEINCKNWLNVIKKQKNGKNILNTAIKLDKKGIRLCLLCRKKGHNEKNCPMRKSLLSEVRFLGEVRNIFTL